MMSHLHTWLQLAKVAVWISWELLIATLLNDLTIIQDEQCLTVADRTKSVSNDDWCAAFHRPIESLLHNLLALLVKSWGSFVKYENLGVFDKGSSNCDPLLLSTGEFLALEAAVLLEAFVQLDTAVAATHPLDDLVLKLKQSLKSCIDANLWIGSDVVDKAVLTLLLRGPLLDHCTIEAVLVSFRRFNYEVSLLRSQLELISVNNRLNFTSPLKV